MAASTYWYGKALLQILDKQVDFAADTIKVALCSSSYTPDQDAHDFFDDITNELATAGGYTAGGATLASCAVTYDAPTNVVKLDAEDVSWADATFTARYAIIYDAQTGEASTSPLIAYVDFGEDKSPSAGTFTIQWHEDGILTATVS